MTLAFLNERRRLRKLIWIPPTGLQMLTNSRHIKRRIESEGWVPKRGKGSHRIFKKTGMREVISLPYPEKDLPPGTVKSIYKIAGWPND